MGRFSMVWSPHHSPAWRDQKKMVAVTVAE
jgi:hypothetical protein